MKTLWFEARYSLHAENQWERKQMNWLKVVRNKVWIMEDWQSLGANHLTFKRVSEDLKKKKKIILQPPEQRKIFTHGQFIYIINVFWLEENFFVSQLKKFLPIRNHFNLPLKSQMVQPLFTTCFYLLSFCSPFVPRFQSYLPDDWCQRWSHVKQARRQQLNWT